MGGADSLSVELLMTLITAAGWIFTVVSAMEFLVLPQIDR